jgi:hypothetical protein
MKEVFFNEMKAMDFSPRFIKAVEYSPFKNRDDQRLPGIFVNAEFFASPERDPGGKIIRTGKVKSFCFTWRYFDKWDKRYKKTFRKYSGTEHIYTAPTFEVYRQNRDGKTAFLIVVGKMIYDRFYYDDPLPVIKTFEVKNGYSGLFLTFPSQKETIAIISNGEKPLFFTGVPFMITDVQGDTITMGCGRLAKLSIERIDDDDPDPVFVFSF